MRILLAAAVLLGATLAIAPAPASACHVVMSSSPWTPADDLPEVEFVWDECGSGRMGVCVHDDAWTKCVWIIKGW